MWILFSLISALALSCRNVFSKASLNKLNEYLVMWIIILVAFLCSSIIILFTGIEINDDEFWYLLPLRIFLDSVAFILIYKAMKLKSISLIIPLLAFSPIISMIGAYFINNQALKLFGIFGVIVVIFGSIIIFITEINFNDIKNNKELIIATIYTLTTVTIWGILDSIHTREINASDPYTYYFISNIFFLIIFSFFGYIQGKGSSNEFFQRKNILLNLPLGVFLTFEVITQFLAFENGPVGYVSAIKSTNIGITFVLALIFLKESKGFITTIVKLIGLIISFVGVLMIVLS